MKNVLRISHSDRRIIMDRTFAKLAENTMSPEYAHLQQVRQDYPLYVVERRRIKRNIHQEHYHGLTYRYMEDYIESHGTQEDRYTYDEMKLISECHSKAHRYPVIKNWFLDRFPEIKQFGMDAPEEQAVALQEAAAEPTNITELPVSA